MIRKSVLKARAAHGYAWLQETGPLYGLDHTRLQLRPELIDVRDTNWCPLSHADTFDPPVSGWGHFHAITRRLKEGAQVAGTSKFIRVYGIDKFLNDHGFDIEQELPFGTWGFSPGSDRDWRLLTEAWREIVAADKPAVARIPQDL